MSDKLEWGNGRIEEWGKIAEETRHDDDYDYEEERDRRKSKALGLAMHLLEFLIGDYTDKKLVRKIDKLKEEVDFFGLSDY